MCQNNNSNNINNNSNNSSNIGINRVIRYKSLSSFTLNFFR